MANIAPIRTQVEINAIINNAQQSMAQLGSQIVDEEKQGITMQDPEHRDKVYTLELLWIYLFNILDSNGNILTYYTASANEEKFNNILYGLLTLSKGFGGPSIPLLIARNSTIQFYPSGATNVSPSGGSGGGPALPGGTTFQNTSVNSPVTLVDTFDANLSTFAFFIVSAMGTNLGEGSRTSIISATWNGTNVDFNETRTADAGGITTPITFKVELAAGQIQLNAYTSTDGWVVKGLRILFQNISFTNAQGPMPQGGTTHQILRKASNTDYDVQWFTLTVAALTDLTATVTELNFSSGVTSAIQTQIDNLNTALGNYLALAGGTMSGDIAMNGHKLTGLAAATVNGDALRYEQLIGMYLLLSGGTMSGAIAMGGSKITGLAAATTNGDALRYEQLINQYLLLTGGTLSGNLAMGGNKVTGLAAATGNGEAVIYEQLIARAVTNGVVRSLDLAFQPSLTKDSEVKYSVSVSAGNTQTPLISLQTSPDNITYTEIAKFGHLNQAGIGTFQDAYGELSAYVPTGYYVQLITSGAGSKNYITGQELQF